MGSDALHVCDYAVAFIDLLGQRAAMPERHLPPNQEEAVALVKKSVGHLISTQKLFQDFYNSVVSTESLYSKLPESVRRSAPDMAHGELKWQHFSDGLVVYIPLGAGLTPSPANSLCGLLLASGMLCLLGLAGGSPIRAGVDAAWAVEYRPHELYGSALAHAYKLESEIAQWPRVVVGEGLVGYLRHYAESGDESMSHQYRREIGNLCLKMLSPDVDGHMIVDYLGQGYRDIAKGPLYDEVLEKAKIFVEQQISHWRATQDEKLLQRYETVRSYLWRNAHRT